MKTTIENIKGTDYTVVWYEDVEVKEVAKANGIHWVDACVGYIGLIAYEYTCGATALPPLPRHPKPGDARLLYRYMAEGLMPKLRLIDSDGNATPVKSDTLSPYLVFNLSHSSGDTRCEVYRCLNDRGEEVNVAIREE
jgi:hypothetical protein